MSKQIRIDGSVDMPTDEQGLERNKDGSLPAAHLKAVHWYLIEHELKPYAHNARTMFRFMRRDGTNLEVHLKDILAEYAKFKEANHGSKKVAA